MVAEHYGMLRDIGWMVAEHYGMLCEIGSLAYREAVNDNGSQSKL
jgi:hypothetical protein